LRLGEGGDLLDRGRLDPHEDELGDAVTGVGVEGLAAVGVEQQDPDLAAVARVDEPRRVDQRDAVLRCRSGARQDERGVAVETSIAMPVRTIARSPGSRSTASSA